MLAEAAASCGLEALLVPPRTIAIRPEFAVAGKIIGPPWQKDHKLAATVAALAFGTSKSDAVTLRTRPRGSGLRNR